MVKDNTKTAWVVPEFTAYLWLYWYYLLRNKWNIWQYVCHMLLQCVSCFYLISCFLQSGLCAMCSTLQLKLCSVCFFCSWDFKHCQRKCIWRSCSSIQGGGHTSWVLQGNKPQLPHNWRWAKDLQWCRVEGGIVCLPVSVSVSPGVCLFIHSFGMFV